MALKPPSAIKILLSDHSDKIDLVFRTLISKKLLLSIRQKASLKTS